MQCGTLTAKRLICEVQAVGVAVTFEALSDAVSTAALEVSGGTSPQLCNTVEPSRRNIHDSRKREHQLDQSEKIQIIFYEKYSLNVFILSRIT